LNDSAASSTSMTHTPRSTRKSSVAPSSAASLTHITPSQPLTPIGRSTRSVAGSSARTASSASARSAIGGAPLSAASTSYIAGGRSHMEGGRTVTGRTMHVRVSDTFSPPFSRGPSRYNSPTTTTTNTTMNSSSVMVGEINEEDDQQQGMNETMPQPALETDAFEFGGGGVEDDDEEDNGDYAGHATAAAGLNGSMDERKSPASARRSSIAAHATSPLASPTRSAISRPVSSATNKPKSGQKRPAPAPPRPKPRTTTTNRRRGTMGLIQNAREAGLVGDIDEEPSEFDSDAEGTARSSRRPKRKRIAPLEWWASREQNYTRKSDDPMSSVMPVVDREQPIIKYSKSPAAPRPRPKTKRKVARLPRPAFGSDEESEAAADQTPKLPFPKEMTIQDTDGITKLMPTVAKHPEDIPLECLAGPEREPSTAPHGGKAFEQHEFSSGILLLPPRARKQREIANNNEIFYIISGPTNGLVMHIGQSTVKLSKGDQFMVPYGNVYELHNSSSTHPIKMHFVLVKPAATWIAEWNARQAEQQAAAAINMAAAGGHAGMGGGHMESEEEEEDEEEDEEEERKGRGGRRSASKAGRR